MDQNTNDNVGLEGIRQYIDNVKTFYANLIAWVIGSFKKYWYLLLLGLLLGGGYAYNKHNNSRPYFEGQASFTYNELHKKIYGEMIDKLRNLAHSGSYKTLSEKLKISEQDARLIMDIEAISITNTPLSQDMSTAKLPFYVKVKLIDRTVADTLLVSIERYFNNNEQAKSIIEVNTRKMKDKIVFLDEELTELDSLKKTYHFYMQEQNNHTNPTVNNFNPIELYTESEKLYNMKSDLESGLNNFKAVKILDHFVINDYPVTSSLSKLLYKYAGMGLLISCLLSLLLMALKKV